MSQDHSARDDQQFIETCLRMRLLQASDAESLRESIGSTSGFVAQTALQKGLLTPADVDIVQSLQNPDSVVPGYTILEMIGRGGMGVVYRALQKDLERAVALKTILISNINDSTVAARFEREAKAVAKLQHPNIVQALSFGRHEGRYYFAMEYVPGRTCEHALHEERLLTPAAVWSIVRQVASGLMHALSQNLIHRDIKPANLILQPPPDGSASRSEIVKITDFGLAMFADQSAEQMKLTTGDKIMGSPAYMSPEQFGGDTVDFRSDIYSLGATAWHLLFGKAPFHGPSIAALYRQKSQPLVFDQSSLPVQVPPEQMQLLMAMLHHDVNGRPQDYRQLIDAIDALNVCESITRGVTPLGLPVESKSSRTPPSPISDQPTSTRVFENLQETLPPNSTTASQDQALSTIELTRPQHHPRVSKLKWWGLAAILAAAVVATGVIGSRSTVRGPRTHTRVVTNTPLFDGVTLRGWDVGGSMIGAWNTVQAPDASTAIACTTQQGALSRRYPETPYPRISLFVWPLHDSGPVDIDFAIDSSVDSDVRGCLKISSSGIQLGTKTSDFDAIAVSVTAAAPNTLKQRYHVVHIERQPTDWYVFLEEKLVGTLPIDRVGQGNEIRLVVHGSDAADDRQSSAFFAEVQLYDLEPAGDPKPASSTP
ncbi:MAG: serine/threonine protein kinase [Pirellulaceae bacterium]|nr:serine/threonine protein kinase [Pirellulaceae bacterium]